jgi:hypothetical protein
VVAGFALVVSQVVDRVGVALVMAGPVDDGDAGVGQLGGQCRVLGRLIPLVASLLYAVRELAFAGLHAGHERLHRLGLVVKLGDCVRHVQGEEVVAGGGALGQGRAGGGESAVDVVPAAAGLLDDLRCGQAEQAQLFDGGDLVGGGQAGAVLVLVPLADDPRGLVGVVVAGDDHRDAGAAGLGRGEGAARVRRWP